MGIPPQRPGRDRDRVKQSPVRLASGESVPGRTDRRLVALADEPLRRQTTHSRGIRDELLLTVASTSEIRVVSAGTAGDAFPTQTLAEPCFESRGSLTRGELGCGASRVTPAQRITECS